MFAGTEDGYIKLTSSLSSFALSRICSNKERKTMPSLTEQEIQRNLRAVAHAIAQQELEGLQVTESTAADLRRAAKGEIDTAQVLRNIYSRLSNVPLRRQ